MAENQGWPKRPNKKSDIPQGPSPMRLMMFIFGFILVIVILSSVANTGAVPGVDSALADSKPEPRRPATIFDDEVSVLKVMPSSSWATDDQRINEMIFVKSEWQAKNLTKHIVACDHVRERVDDYGYCWIFHYERR